MPITFSCSCGREITVKDEFAGKKGKCPACGKIVLVPDTGAPAAPAAPAEPAKEEEAYVERDSALTMNQPAVEAEVAGETKTCMHCRKQIAADAVFCIHCGTNLRTGHKSTSDSGGIEGDYDYIKVFPDMITKPSATVETIVQATPSGANFQKALILLVLGSAVMAWMLYDLNDKSQIKLGLWFIAVPFVLALAATVTSGIIAGIAGTMFGTSGLPLANCFMGVLAARTLVGAAMLLPWIFIWSGMPEVSLWVERIVRLAAGGGLMYLVIHRAHDAAHAPALVFAGISVLVEGILFWLVAVIFTWILGTTNTIMLF